MTLPTLLDLPNELLLQLPSYLHNLEDFKNASSTCRRLRTIFADTLPKTVLRLATRAAPTFFSPHPYFLVLAVARQIAAWAVAVETERDARISRLAEAFRGDVAGLLDFALRDDVEGVGLTMSGVRRMYEARFSVINPLNDTIDAMIGNAWYAQPDFWNGGAEDAFTLQADVNSATMQLLIYGELFGPTMDSFLLPRQKRTPGLDIDTRIEFVKYCIPDWVCRTRRDGFKVLPVGPYAANEEGRIGWNLQGNQTALAHMLGGAMFEGILWKRAWRKVLIAAGAEKNEDGKWPTVWIEKLQKIGFRERGTNVSEGEEPAGAGDEAGRVAEEPDGDRQEDRQVDGEDTDNEDRDGNSYEEDEDAAEAESNGEDENDEDEDEEGDDVESTATYDSEPGAEPVRPSPDDWRFTLFWNALTQAGGLQTLIMVAQFKGREENKDISLKLEWKAKIVELRDQALALKDEDEPGYKDFGKRAKLRISEAPDLAAELYWCCGGMWRGF